MIELKSNSALHTRKLQRDYRLGPNVIHALVDLNLDIRKGEFVAIMGPSGCGKSTLLNLLGGLDYPTRGKVFIDGQDLAAFNEEDLAALRRKKIGFIFQRHDLFPVLTARENVEFPMLLAETNAQDRQTRAQQLLELVGLADKSENLPEELSGGQQQRIGIARALANASEILLADEPTGNLDSYTAENVMKVLIDLVKNRGLTLVMVTHDSEVAAYADRIVQLQDGHLVNQNGVIK